VAHRLAVDFGTTHTVAVLGRPDGRTGPLLFDGSPLLTSGVFANPDGRLLTGRDAAHAARARPEAFEPHPKRRIDDGTVLLDTMEIPVADLIAAVLRRVADEATRITGGTPVAHTVLSYPAAWGQPRRETLLAAAATAFGRVDLVAEPVAAASHFVHTAGSPVPVGGYAAVYDLGAGTFDATIVRRTDTGFDVLGTEGLDDAGGLDIDAAIRAHLADTYTARDPATWQRLVAPTSPGDRRASRQLWDDIRTGKEMLSRAPTTLIHIPLFDDEAPLGREQLDRLAAPILDRTVATTRRVLAGAGVDPGDLAALFLVGGASRTPLVATLLHRDLGITPTAIDQPELAVAEGCLHALRPVREGAPAAGPGTLPLPAPAPGRRRLTRPAVLVPAIAALVAAIAGAALAGASLAGNGDGDGGQRRGTAGPSAGRTTESARLAPTPTPAPSSIADPCLLGTWDMIAWNRSSNRVDSGDPVTTTSDGGVVRIFRPDGTARLEYDDAVEAGTRFDTRYEITWNGVITSNYRTRDGELLWTDARADGEAVVTSEGRELFRENMRADSASTTYICEADRLLLYSDDDDETAEYVRASTEWDD
jgi:hypothetical protein